SWAAPAGAFKVVVAIGCVSCRKRHWWLAKGRCAPSQATKWSRALQSDILGRQHRMVRERVRRVQEIADWLDKLGMSEYALRFAENRVDFSVLPDLSDQDLEKMGVVLGDRRKILRAIAGLDDAEKAAQNPAAWAEATSAVRPRDAAERRQV